MTLTAFLSSTHENFAVMGVDVLVQEHVQLMLGNLDLAPTQRVSLLEGNSLDMLPQLVKRGVRFDVVLLDGDHNYHTVAKELEHIENLTHPGSVVICDDYDGRWSEKDLWYSERGGYEGCKLATPRVATEKQGVKAAVDEWLAARPGWRKAKPVPGEPVLLTRDARLAP